MTSHDRRAIRRYTFLTNAYQLRTWWYGKGPWFHIFVAAGLVCAFELAVAYAAYPYLERMVAS